MAKADKSKVALGVGLGIAAAAAAASAAGYYFYGNKDAKKNRKKAAKWATNLKADVIKKAKKLKDLDEQAYRTIVDEAMKAYTSVKSVDQKDLEDAVGELKENFENVRKELVRVSRKGKKAVKTAVKKSVKKVAKKATKKAAPKKVAKKTKKPAKKKK